MSDEPTDTEPTHDEFTPDPDEATYPSELRITSQPAEQAQAASVERAERWGEGEEVPHVVNFEDAAQLRELLTNRRIELLESVMADSPASIRALAARLDRDVRDVHDDLQLLAEYDIVHFREEGRAKQPYVPYDTVSIEVTLTKSVPDGSESTISA